MRRRVYAAVWIGAGIVLWVRSAPYLGLGGDVVALEGLQVVWALVLALLVGVLKGRTVLARAARNAVDRMVRAGDRAPLRSLFPIHVVVLIATMMALGVALRTGPYPDWIRAWVVGVLYPGIGLALFIGGATLLTHPAGVARPEATSAEVARPS